MTRREFRGFTFEPPKDWQDRSVVAFATAPGGTAEAASLSVTQDQLQEGDTLRLYGNKVLVSFGKQLTDFEVQEVKDLVLAGLPALRMRFTWLSHFGKLEQSVTLVQPDPSAPALTSFTTTAPFELAPRCWEVWNAFFDDLRFEGGDDAPASQPPNTLPIPPQAAGDAPVSIPMPGRKSKDRR